ncbi:MAG: hypothetical protein K2X47_09465 [Bdellovibrionales bacterium]|nr:hypothetical protein [Bdellovibrionales bacterium]
MKLGMFGIFSALAAAAALSVASLAEARIRKEKLPQIKAQSIKVKQKLGQLKYKPGSYVVRAIDLTISGTRAAPVYSLLTDVSPKILKLSPEVINNKKSVAAIRFSVDSARASAQAQKKNDDWKGMLYIVVTSEGTVTRVSDLSNLSAIPKEDTQKIADIERLKKKRARSVSKPYNTSAQFDPSILASKKQLDEVYNDVDPLNHDYMDLSDNCFNRAHYWARSNEIGVSGNNTKREKQGGVLSSRSKAANASIHSEKVFVFFTSRYQREFNHKWWYHTAPTVQVQNGDENERFVLDRSYTEEPLTVEEWVYTFAGEAEPGGKIQCKPLKNLSEYYAKTETEYCFWYEGANMYTYTPNDLMQPNSETQWTCDSLYGVTQGIPYPKVPYGPRPKSASELFVGEEAVEYNDYVTTEENQAGWTMANKGQFIPDFCQ